MEHIANSHPAFYKVLLEVHMIFSILLIRASETVRKNVKNKQLAIVLIMQNLHLLFKTLNVTTTLVDQIKPWLPILLEAKFLLQSHTLFCSQKIYKIGRASCRERV